MVNARQYWRHPVGCQPDANLKVYRFLERCGAELFPPRCLFCRIRCGEHWLCPACAHELPPARPGCPRCADPAAGQRVCLRCLVSPPPWQHIHAALDYSAAARHLVHRLKIAHQLPLARVLAQLFVVRCAPVRPQYLVPVASHRSRLLARGFNPALEIARCLGRRMDLPVLPRALTRLRNDPPQAGRSARQRARAPKGAFAGHRQVKGRRIALVDDVLTTGATARAATAALRQAGAERVDLWVMARA